MSNYQLTVEFDDAGLNTLNQAGQLVTIVKTVSSGMPVAWVAFAPMEQNIVSWTEDYSVYASTTAITGGAKLFTQSTKSADGGKTYTLAGGRFDDGTSGLPPSSYAVLNNDAAFKIGGVEMITSGLYQGAMVNGNSTASPLNAVKVPYGDTGEFIPVEKIQIFASNYQDNGIVISSVTSQALTVDLTQTTTATVHYNDATNQFSFGPLNSSAVRSTPARR